MQNVPVQLPVSLLRPYAVGSADVKLLGERARIGAQIVSGNSYTQLNPTDELILRGDYRVELKLTEKKTKLIRHWMPIGIPLVAGTPTIVLARNPNRVRLYLTNKGASDIQFFFGELANFVPNSSPLLTPKGSFNEVSDTYRVESPLVAMSVGSDGFLSGMEGLL